MKTAALYARVSSERQKEEQTIGSQTEALKEYAKTNGYTVLPEWVFQDEGYSGATLKRPDLERLRDLAAEGQIETILVHSPDRLSRKYAYQVLPLASKSLGNLQTQALIEIKPELFRHEFPSPRCDQAQRLHRAGRPGCPLCKVQDSP
jgi:site-specific DNA recombinase